MQMAGSTRLGPKRELTREGYLICRDVPMGRTGEMIYAKGSIRDEKGNEAVEADDRGLIVVNRSADVLFHPDTISSAFGKPATIIHPAGNLVTPLNYAQTAKGTISNPRRGTGIHDDMLLGDITFYDRNAIDAIQRGDFGPNPEVSLGADSGFIQVRPGYAEAAWIRINHVAVVPKGRCGPRCAIGDGEEPMTIKELLARARAAFTAGNTADGEAALAEAETLSAATTDNADPNAALLARLDAIEARLPASTSTTITIDGAEMAETIRGVIQTETAPLIARIEAFETAARTADEAEAARTAAAATADAALVGLYPVTRIADVTANAEILAPGYRPAQPIVATGSTADCAQAMCGCQRGALAASYATAEGKAAIDMVLAGRSADFASMDAITVDTVFSAASAIRAAQNNATKGQQRGAPNGYQPPMSPNDRLKAGVAKFNAG